ncbi:hypothetical protein P9112_010512 [Eukaryota sp. TZLM1-RC]
MLEGLDGTTIITDVCNNSFIPLAQSKHKNPLSVTKIFKIDKYKAKLLFLNAESHTHYVLCPVAFSLHGTLVPPALSFLDDFVEIVKHRTGSILTKRFGRLDFFPIFKGYVPLLSYLLSCKRSYAGKTSSNFFLTDLGYDDLEF